MITNYSRAPVRKCLSFFAAICLMAAGCADPPGGDNRVHPTYDEKTGRLTRLAYDSDGDGSTDTWGVMDGARVVRVEADENQDGKVDRWEHHLSPSDGQGLSPLETIERVERSTRHDGQVSRWEHFEKGVLVRVEEDTNGDHKVDKWETYAGGSLISMALDTEGLGKPDRRLTYRFDGSLDRLERLSDGSVGNQSEPAAQGPVSLSGTAKDEAKKPYLEFSARARDIQQGLVAGLTLLDLNGNFSLAGLTANTYIIELLNTDGKVVCTEGPFDMTQQTIKNDITIDCDKIPVAWWLLGAAALAGIPAGVAAGRPMSPAQ
jgi:hypothetical protein